MVRSVVVVGALLWLSACDMEEPHPHLDAAETICSAIDECLDHLDEMRRADNKQQCIYSYLDLFDTLEADDGPMCSAVAADVYRCVGAGGTCESISSAECSEQSLMFYEACPSADDPPEP